MWKIKKKKKKEIEGDVRRIRVGRDRSDNQYGVVVVGIRAGKIFVFYCLFDFSKPRAIYIYIFFSKNVFEFRMCYSFLWVK